MKLIFSHEYKSISDFNEVEFPDFCVLTGKNGSGKTHLLEAIKNGSVKYDSIESNRIKYFNFQSFRVENQSTGSKANFETEKGAAWRQFNILQNVYFKEMFDENGKKISDDISHMDKDKIIAILARALKANYPNLKKFPLPYIVRKCNRVIKEFMKLCENKKKEELQNITQARIKNYLDPITELENLHSLTENQLILNNLSQIFFDYRMKLILSSLPEEHGGEGKSKKEIVDIEKNSPWNILHEMLEILELPHKFTIPKFTPADIIAGNSTDYNTHLDYNNQNFDFDSLSSGEKVLFTLALVIFQNQRLGDLPQLLLLDEIDATLHPSMIKNLLHVIKDIFLENGCKVILATHSPTTISLVNESAIFEVKKGECENKIEKISQINAVEILSEGQMSLKTGLTLFDQVSQQKLSIISEGDNVKHIKKAIEILDKKLLHNIGFIDGIQSKSGEQQLKTLFDFFKLAEHENHILFIFDCDVKKGNRNESNKDHIFIFDENNNNHLAQKGIENIYPENLFDNFTIKIEDSQGEETKEFDKKRKRAFLNAILQSNNLDDFKNYHPLIEKIKEILETAEN